MTDRPFPDDAQRADLGIDAQPGLYTGRHLLLLSDTDVGAALSALREGAGVRAYPGGASGTPDEGSAAVFDRLGVAVVSADPGRHEALLATARQAPSILAVELERWMFGFGAPTAAIAAEEGHATWGLRATGVPESACRAHGVRVAVLDTGFAPVHRDFADRVVVKVSFVPGRTADDRHGHGTHCIGTACGPRRPGTHPAYGIASEAEIYAGKVLDDAGSGTDLSVIAGIDWAVGEGCRVISLSLGAPVRSGEGYSRVYESLARRARALGTLIVAAAGNDSGRPGYVAPVSHPANCPSILAVAALAPDLSVAGFSAGGGTVGTSAGGGTVDTSAGGGTVDIAAPGVDVLSAAPEPAGHARMSGTSMAAPHVAGIVALLAEAYPCASASELADRVLGGARALPVPSTDVGSGLVQAPR